MSFPLNFSPVSGLCSAPPVADTVEASPPCCLAPLPGVVARLAAAAGASFLSIRPSYRSFSLWVCCVFFRSFAEASTFSKSASSAFDLPFCAVRLVGAKKFAVSVPCSISDWHCPPDSVPCLVVSFQPLPRILSLPLWQLSLMLILYLKAIDIYSKMIVNIPE
ncbi:MAG TPA: hypothetical protein DEG17_16055 [Cyanobacteria bacterium UBA11149]|nr:hypothetical protein [Cyanobacteria bacterium UBA11367]HBE59039.1 hypothetical protein [Cyanobacteria bacterium UBA11366]HBK63077.1 hypothetical protein [Cyanobacteria bacterium UBA11166]HBR74520.1 hypothetical protein [Cyanobacteria bacterium UBA11159]HBS72027.1 hypothetical protein [Cyanobacteria bacterium UBA11153]HBW90341.1 hypothetical protein [Cyanobacteria bacterium UBA11149]HCA94849.1 hypothetical protein [Cyanobacteria bacterium UBA9226]